MLATRHLPAILRAEDEIFHVQAKAGIVEVTAEMFERSSALSSHCRDKKLQTVHPGTMFCGLLRQNILKGTEACQTGL